LSYPEKNKRPQKKDVHTRTNFGSKSEEAVRQFRSSNTPYDLNGGHGIYSDMLGSYTGMSYDGGEPEQDADDL